VNVKTTSGFVGQDEIAFPAVVAMLLAKASHAKYGAKARYLRVRHRDIEVIVRPRLLSEHGINRPSPVDINLQAILFQKLNEVGGVLLEHNCSVAAVLKRRIPDQHEPSLVLHRRRWRWQAAAGIWHETWLFEYSLDSRRLLSKHRVAPEVLPAECVLQER
jgi:hypothetical protein